MAMGRVDDDHVHFGIDQRFGPFETLVANSGCCGNAQAPGRILGCIGIGHGLLDILDCDQTNAAPVIIHNQQLFDAPLMKQLACFFLAGAERHGSEVFGGHQFADRLARIFRETNVAIGQYSDQLAAAIRDRDPADAMLGHDFLSLPQRCIRVDGDGIDHHAAFIPLYRANSGGLFIDLEIAVKNADPTQLRHGDGHVGFRHRVHRGRDDGDIQCDFARQPRGRIGHGWQDLTLRRYKKYVVESKTEGNVEMCHVENRLPEEMWRPM